MNWIEILGYAASLLVAISLTMSSLARLRALNLVGAGLFAVYGWLVGAIPVLLVNGFIAVVNVVFLARMQPGRSEAFELLAIGRRDNRYLQRFLEFHRRDIALFSPGFDAAAAADPRIVFILRDMQPVGLVICEPAAGGDLRVLLDYVIPSYRDFRCAHYFYSAWSTVVECPGARRFVATGGSEKHRWYLKKVGFAAEPALGPDVFVRAA
ncbi:MAG: YgjV family protein [bacterium]|nr:YgjV family protein [bacterium]